MEKIKVGVVGATGYAGSEICRMILGHPQAELKAISSVSFEGMELSKVYPAYYQLCDMVCGTEAVSYTHLEGRVHNRLCVSHRQGGRRI